jgi:hypothetical protein
MIRWTRWTLVVCALLLAVTGIAPVYPQADNEVIVTASVKTGRDGGVIYQYRVTNNHAKDEIRGVAIGWGDRGFELTEPPLGWTFYAGLPQSSATSPPGWSPEAYAQEESEFVSVSWQADDPEKSTIGPGQSLSGFSVVVPKQDDAYLNGHANILYTNSRRITVPLKRSTK